MKRPVIAAVGLALAVGVLTTAFVACTTGKVVEQIIVVTPTVPAVEEPESATSPIRQPTPEPRSRPELTLDDAPYFLDVGSVLPGFKKLDPTQDGFTKEELGLGPRVSDVVVYLSEQPFQFVMVFMGLLSGDIEKASARVGLRREEALEEFLIAGLFEGMSQFFDPGSVETDVQWNKVSVGDTAKLAQVTMTDLGLVLAEVDVLLFLQEEGREMAQVIVMSVWLPEAPAAVDTLTVGREVSSRIANR